MDSSVVILGKTIKIVIFNGSKPKQSSGILYLPLSFTEDQLRVYLRQRLKRVVNNEYRKLSKETGFSIIGEINFETVSRFQDRSMLAALKGSTILIREDAIKLSRVGIREILIHEIAHLLSKGHGERFQMAVRFIGGKQRRLPVEV